MLNLSTCRCKISTLPLINERGIGFFGFLFLSFLRLIFRFCTQNVQFFSSGIQCILQFFLFLIFDFSVLLLKKCFLVFYYLLV